MGKGSSSGQDGYIKKRRLLLRKRLRSYRHEERDGREGSFSYEPKWEGAIEGYVVKEINRNYWRFKNHVDFDDAYQEAHLKFLEMKERYMGSIDSPKWFMSLYKTALANKLTDLAKLSSRLRRQVCFVELDGEDEDEGYQESLVGTIGTEGMLQVRLEEAPYEVRRVLSLVLHSPPELLSAMADTWNDKGKRVEGGNQFLCKMLGYDPRKVDLVELVKDYLQEEENDNCYQDYDDGDGA